MKPGAAFDERGKRLTGGIFQVTVFTPMSPTTFTVLTTTNVALSVTSWAFLGPVIKVRPAQFFPFNDSQSTRNTLLFKSPS